VKDRRRERAGVIPDVDRCVFVTCSGVELRKLIDDICSMCACFICLYIP
jgi:hypothetical protein